MLESCKLIGGGIGSVFGSFVIVLSRNSSIQPEFFKYIMLGFAMIEAMGLFFLMMAFFILFS